MSKYKTYLRFQADCLDDAKLYDSMSAAVAAYKETAEELRRYDQRIDASLHFASNREELSEYPDRILSLGPNGGLKVEHT